VKFDFDFEESVLGRDFSGIERPQNENLGFILMGKLKNGDLPFLSFLTLIREGGEFFGGA
jgi:hypothetical protein